MLWNKETTYRLFPYQLEAELEEAVNEVKTELFGENRILP